MPVTIECQQRPQGVKPKAMRRQGLIPAALYGHNGTESVSVAVASKEAERLLRHASVNNTLVNVKIPHASWQGQALIRDVQTHPWKPHLYHLSFFAVAAQEEVEVSVPLHIHGEPIGVKQQNGILEDILDEIPVRCAASQIPESVEIDVSGMETGDSYTIGDLILPEGVVPADDPESPVVTVVAASRAAATAAEAEADASEGSDTLSEATQL